MMTTKLKESIRGVFEGGFLVLLFALLANHFYLKAPLGSIFLGTLGVIFVVGSFIIIIEMIKERSVVSEKD